MKSSSIIKFTITLLLLIPLCAKAQVKVTLQPQEAFSASNLLIISDGQNHRGVISLECLVIDGVQSLVQLVYLPNSDRTINWEKAWMLGKNELITFDKVGGTTHSHNIPEAWKQALYINKGNEVSYVPNNSAIEAQLSPLRISDVRSNETEHYALVKVGLQVWMRENLRTFHFANGEDIPLPQNKSQWEETKQPAVTIYDGKDDNKAIMGALYNWYAVVNEKGLAPKGWKVPSLDDYKTLVKYLDPKGFMPDEYDNPWALSYTVGEQLKSKQGWTTPPNPGSGKLQVGNNLAQLNIAPMGSTSTSKYFNGYSGKGLQAYLWTSSENADESKKAMFIRFYWDSQVANTFYEDKFMGFSVRCIAVDPLKLAPIVETFDRTEFTLEKPGTLASFINENHYSQLSSLVLSGKVDARDFATLAKLKKLSSLTLNNVAIVAYKGNEGPIKGTKQYPAGELPMQALMNNQTLRSFEAIGEQITSLGAKCFENCSQLSSVKLPHSITEFAGSNFKNCIRLTTIKLPLALTDLGYSTFEGCSSLTQIELPTQLSELGESVFKNCTALTQISIPTQPHDFSIGMSAFEGCSALKEITIPNNVTAVGMFAFQNCTALSRVILSNSLDELAYGTFIGATSLNDVVIPKSVKSIGAFCFQGCSALKQLTIPKSVTKIANGAFRGVSCSFNLPPESVFKVEKQMLLTNDGKLLIHLPANYLGKLVIPQGVEVIGGAACADCKGLREVDIPASVKNIKLLAFDNTAIYSVTMRSLSPSSIVVGEAPFGEMDYSRCELHVDKTAIDAYKRLEPWNKFNILGEILSSLKVSPIYTIISTTPLVIKCPIATPYSVYTLSGIVLKRGATTSPFFTLADDIDCGTYIITLGTQSFKVSL